MTDSRASSTVNVVSWFRNRRPRLTEASVGLPGRHRVWGHGFHFSSEGGLLVSRHQLMEKKACSLFILLKAPLSKSSTLVFYPVVILLGRPSEKVINDSTPLERVRGHWVVVPPQIKLNWYQIGWKCSPVKNLRLSTEKFLNGPDVVPYDSSYISV